MKRALAEGVRQLARRPIYIIVMVLVPIGMSFFFLDLMNKGLPLQSPTAVVDLDNTPLSRRVVRNLDTSELVDIQYRPSSYGDAMKLLKTD